MTMVFLCLGIFCVLYGVIGTLLTSFSSFFVGFWLGFAILFFSIYGGRRYMLQHEIQVPKFIKITVGVILIIGFCGFSILEGLIIVHGNQMPKAGASYMIILGAKVNGDTPSSSLKRRLETAYTYLQNNNDTKVIVTGGKGEGENVTEAQAMKKYLVAKGMEPTRIMLEEKATNTSENISFSKKMISDASDSVVVVSNGYHIYRSLLLCESFGITNAEGLGAETPLGLHISCYAREAAAVLKDIMVLKFHI